MGVLAPSSFLFSGEETSSPLPGAGCGLALSVSRAEEGAWAPFAPLVDFQSLLLLQPRCLSPILWCAWGFQD